MHGLDHAACAVGSGRGRYCLKKILTGFYAALNNILMQRQTYVASVIVPTYNRSQLLDYTLHSLSQQTLPKADFEVLVVDDGSTDDTLEVVNKYRNVLNLKYFFQEDKGYRPGSARNIGIRHAEGEICVFIDSGVVAGTACVMEHVNSHRRSPGPATVIGYVFGFDQGNTHGEALKEIIDWRTPDATIAYFKSINQYLDIREPCYVQYNDELDALPAPWAFFWTCNVSVGTDMLRAVGLFDENYDYTWGVEDHDLGYRLQLHDVTFGLNRNAVSIHYPHAKDAEEKFKQEMKNKYYFHQKYNSLSTGLFLSSTYEDLNEKLMLKLAGSPVADPQSLSILRP